MRERQYEREIASDNEEGSVFKGKNISDTNLDILKEVSTTPLTLHIRTYIVLTLYLHLTGPGCDLKCLFKAS